MRGFRPHFTDLAAHVALFDTLSATAESLQRDLIAGKLKSTQIVEEYHRSISKHDGYLNAVYELAPGAMSRAREMDQLRSQGSVLGPLHGIPVILKDNMDTDSSMGMSTTGGAMALVDAEPAGNARIVDKLLEGGMIILGKATMSELGFFKGKGLRCGWSAVHGQAQSAYVFGGLDMSDSIVGHSSPSGSSSGSAIATSAGLTPLALGTETFGSLVNPATRAALYTVKPTLGVVSGEGIIPISKDYDTAGPLAKCPRDVADLLTILIDPSKTAVPAGGYASALGGGWGDIKVGVLDPLVWNSPPYVIKPVKEATEQIVQETNEAYEKIKGLAKAFHADLTDKTDDQFMLDDSFSIEVRLAFSLEDDLGQYLSRLKSSSVRSLRELVDWNFKHAEDALTAEYANQDLLVSGLNDDHDPAKLERIKAHMRQVGDGFMKIFDDYDIDVVIGPGDSGLYNFSAACGFPLATLPISTLRFNGRPFGLTVAARPHHEAMLVKTMGAWEANFPGRQTPKAFLEVSKPNV